MKIRRFDPGDEAALIALWQECGLTRPWNDPHADIARKLREQPELFLVGTVGAELIASVMVGYDGHRGWAYYLAVAPGHRRQAHGRALMQEAERLLRERGCPKLNLLVRSSNTGVIEFYRRLGYLEDEVIGLGKRLIHDQPPGTAAARDAAQPSIRIRSIDHLVLRVLDLEKMLHFYCTALGCSIERRVDAIGLVQLRAGRSLLDLVPVDGELGRAGGSAPGAEGRNLDHFCLRVEPFDAAEIRTQLAQHGYAAGAVESRYGAEGKGPSVYVTDPEGNVVELKGPAAG